jgi:hypothetical protein
LNAAGTTAQVVHIPSDFIAGFDPEWGAGLLGDKSHSMIFNNAKIKQAVPGFAPTIPYSLSACEVIAWYDEDVSRRKTDPAVDAKIDEIIARFESGFPKRTRLR